MGVFERDGVRHSPTVLKIEHVQQNLGNPILVACGACSGVRIPNQR